MFLKILTKITPTLIEPLIKQERNAQCQSTRPLSRVAIGKGSGFERPVLALAQWAADY